MSIRRISELPGVKTINPSSALSDSLIEVSYDETQGSHKYKSAYIRGTELCEDFITYFGDTGTTNITINKGGLLLLDHATLSAINGSNIMAWPNTPTTGTKCYLHFGEIKLSADEELDIEGNPVVINKQLSVYTDKTVGSARVQFMSLENTINSPLYDSDAIDDRTIEHRVANLGTIKNVVGAINSLIERYATGAGV